jgi:hypothetical protein
LSAAVAVFGLIAGLASATTAVQPAFAATPTPVYPDAGPGTSILDHEAKLGGLADPQWYESNVPFVDLPDKEIESTYYYRWRTFKEALKYSGPEDGWIVTEFLPGAGYAAPGGAISAAAGHHLYEGRWLRDSRYMDDYVDYWLTGSGSEPKPATDGLNENTTDWSHQYSFWVADAVLAQAKIDGDVSRAEELLPELIEQWNGWAPQFNADLGLYWQVPVWDAMEFTASSYQSDDPYHGGEGYRPTLNAYQYGDAMAISEIAALAGDQATADAFATSAANLQAAQEKYLWDADSEFYKHVMRDDNPNNAQIVDREQIGFIPWYFHMAPAANDASWAQLLDPQGFKAAYGPTTVERRSPWFMFEAGSCCRWDGPSWPYATSQTLTAAGNLLADYPAQDYVTADDFTGLVHDYAMTQRKNGQPYVAEAHHPDEDRWIYDGANHSEDYNHSTFNDIVLGSLIGIKGQDDDSVRIAPQTSSDWDHFAAENVPYHGHNLTVVWDEDGSHYEVGAGMTVFVDGVQAFQQAALGDVTIEVGPTVATELPEQIDDASNQYARGFPHASASFTNNGDPASMATDGQDFALDIPKTRWTNYGTPNSSDWLEVDFGVPTPVSDVRTTFYDDGGGVQPPTSYDVEFLDEGGTWSPLPEQVRSPELIVGGAVNRITLDTPVLTSAIRLVGVKKPGVGGWGVTSFASWRTLDDNLTASIDTRADGIVAIQPGSTSQVTTHVVVGPGEGRIAAENLYAPQGITVTRVSPPIPADAPPGEYTTTWELSASPELDAATEAPLRYIVDSTVDGRGAGALAVGSWVFDPDTFGDAVWDDDFTTDRLGEYTAEAGLDEPAAGLSVDAARGTLDVTATSRARENIQIPVRAGSSFALIVAPESFIEGDPAENSLFVGSSGSPRDFAMSWFNKSRDEGGVNVVVDGQGKGDAEGSGSRPENWEPGDRLATVVTDGWLTSWIEKAGTWTRINTAPVSVAIPPETLEEWFPSFAIRMDAGLIALDRVTVLRGGLVALTPAPVTFDDQAGTAHDTYTVPEVDGVEYLRDGAVVPAGTYPGEATVVVTARASGATELALGATTEWSHSFSDAAEPVDPPGSTDPTNTATPTPGAVPTGPAGDAEHGTKADLATTGLSVGGWLLAALALIVVGAAVGRRRRAGAGNSTE